MDPPTQLRFHVLELSALDQAIADRGAAKMALRRAEWRRADDEIARRQQELRRAEAALWDLALRR